MNHGTQLSPAESAAMCGTDWFAFDAEIGFGPPPEPRPDGLALLLLPLCCDELAFELVFEDPLPPAVELDVVGAEPLVVGVVAEELGATGIVDSGVPLGLPDELELPPPLLPPTPGMAEPY
jgi:hypothetical protein